MQVLIQWVWSGIWKCMPNKLSGDCRYCWPTDHTLSSKALSSIMYWFGYLAIKSLPRFRLELLLKSWRKSECISAEGAWAQWGLERPGRVLSSGTYCQSMADALGFDWDSWSHPWPGGLCSLCSMSRISSRPGFGGLLWEVKECHVFWDLNSSCPLEVSVMVAVWGQPVPRYNNSLLSQVFCSSPWPAGPGPSALVALSRLFFLFFTKFSYP